MGDIVEFNREKLKVAQNSSLQTGSSIKNYTIQAFMVDQMLETMEDKVLSGEIQPKTAFDIVSNLVNMDKEEATTPFESMVFEWLEKMAILIKQ